MDVRTRECMHMHCVFVLYHVVFRNVALPSAALQRTAMIRMAWPCAALCCVVLFSNPLVLNCDAAYCVALHSVGLLGIAFHFAPLLTTYFVYQLGFWVPRIERCLKLSCTGFHSPNVILELAPLLWSS